MNTRCSSKGLGLPGSHHPPELLITEVLSEEHYNGSRRAELRNMWDVPKKKEKIEKKILNIQESEESKKYLEQISQQTSSPKKY